MDVRRKKKKIKVRKRPLHFKLHACAVYGRHSHPLSPPLPLLPQVDHSTTIQTTAANGGAALPAVTDAAYAFSSVSGPTCVYWLVVVRNAIVWCACPNAIPLPPSACTQYENLLNIDMENTSIDDILSGVHELGSSIPGTQGYSEAIPVSDNPTTVHAVPAAPTGHPNAALVDSVTAAPTGHPNTVHSFDPAATAPPTHHPNAALVDSVTAAPTGHTNVAHVLANPVPDAPTGHPHTTHVLTNPVPDAPTSYPHTTHVLANSVTVAPIGHPNTAHVLANLVPDAPTSYPHTTHVLANQNDGGHFATYGQHPGAQFPPVSTQYVPNSYALQPPPAFPYHVSPHAVSALCQFLMTAFAPPTSGYHSGFFR
jgi:hypothetical protein